MSEYDGRFFDSIREGCQRSAEVVVPLLVEQFQPRSVVDVGCGGGWWGKAFQDAGCEVLGLDGDYADPVIPWQAVDLATYGVNVGTFDLAICLEVAEHLPPESAEDFVATLCTLAPVVVFSAAVPGQGGTGHVNERWPTYWRDLFTQHHYEGSGALRWTVWDDERIKWWYRQDLLVFARELPDGLPADGCPAVIHPGCWLHHGKA